MVWADVPVVTGDWATAAQCNEVIAAINERDAESYAAGNLAVVVSGDWILATKAEELQARIENMIPYFRNVDDGGTGEAWTKSALLTAAIGAADWTNASVAGGDWLLTTDLNEMRLVLNKMMWVYQVRDSFAAEKFTSSNGWSNVSWDAAWAAAKTAYGTAAWNNYASGPSGGYTTTSLSPYGGYTYWKNINHWRTSDVAFVIPNHAVAVADTKLRFSASERDDGGDGAGDIDLFDAASFGGTKVADISVSGYAPGTKILVDVPTVVKNTTVHYSYRTDPVVPTHDNYEAGDTDGFVRGWGISTPQVINKLTFVYQ